MRRIWLTSLPTALLLGSCSLFPSAEDIACRNIDCGPAGTCILEGEQLFCVCEIGAVVDEESRCQPGGPPESCADEPCGDHGTCSEETGEFRCTCDDNYEGERCERCTIGYQDNDLDGICLPTCTTAGIQCGPRGVCSDAAGGPRCVCQTAYAGARCDRCAGGYQDEDGDGVCLLGCAASGLGCSPGGVCDDSTGTPACICSLGHEGDECKTCTPGYQDNDGNGSCELSCSAGAIQCDANRECSDRSGQALCVCAPGFRGPDCEPLPQIGDPCADEGANDCSAMDEQLVCTAGMFALQDDCGAVAEGCRETSSGVFECVPLLSQFDPCTQDEQCQWADPYLVCEADFCMLSCSTDQQCGVDQDCSFGLCYPRAVRGDACFADENFETTGDPLVGCLDPEDACQPVFSTPVGTGVAIFGVCSEPCPPGDLYQQSVCDPGELCLRNPQFWNTDPPGGTTCSSQSECTTIDPSLECVRFQTGFFCAANRTLCADPINIWDGDTSQGVPDEVRCGVKPTEDPFAVKVDLCTLEGAASTDARSECVPNINDVSLGVCVAVCEDPDDTSQDLSCGPNASCMVPAPEDALLFEFQDPNVPIFCEPQTALLDCAPTHPLCRDVGFGFLECVRAIRFCR